MQTGNSIESRSDGYPRGLQPYQRSPEPLYPTDNGWNPEMDPLSTICHVPRMGHLAQTHIISVCPCRGERYS